MATSGTPINPLFGIAWELVINTAPDAQGNATQITALSKDYSSEGLEIQFEVSQTVSSGENGFWFADVSIFGLNDNTTQKIIQQGQTVKLNAGWQNNQPYGTIFEGTLYQPLWERVDGINYKLTLHCIVGLLEQVNNFCAFSIAGGATQRDIVARMASTAMNPLDTSNVNIPDANLTPSSRGEVVFGQPSLYLEQIGKETQTSFWFSNMAINIQSLRTAQTGIPTISYNANTGLIGTPQLTQDGLLARVLLDPRLQLAGQIHLNPSVTINQVPHYPGDFPTVFDKDGNYGIIGLTHRGDSRGNIWQTEIIGLTYVGSKLAVLGQ
jgi:hypothetical protein